ncbi:MAG: hypothetical protein IPM34_10875 [Saprospiraceae bacterium]|nr:hypothetical protein [Saprospiraceae bacterium]
MIVTLYGIPDEHYFKWRNKVLEEMKALELEFKIEECTSLNNILQKGIKEVPCLMIGDQIIDYKTLSKHT